MKKSLQSFEFGAPLVTSLLVVAMSGLTVFAAPSYAPPGGNVPATFDSASVPNIMNDGVANMGEVRVVDPDGFAYVADALGPMFRLDATGVSNPSAALGGAVVVNDAQGLATTGPITTGGNLSAVGHLKAASIGDYQIAFSTTGNVAPDATGSATATCMNASDIVISCGIDNGTGADGKWALAHLYPNGNTCEMAAVNLGMADDSLKVKAVCFNPNL